MANFGICRVIKHSTRGSVTASANHNFRAVDTPNADPARLHLNEHAGAGSVFALNAAIDDRFASLTKKPRKNSVVALEYFVGLSPDAEIFKDKARLDKYFDDAIGCIVNRHGVENVLVASRHNDEKTPHLCIIVTPVDSLGHLNARAFTGGFYKMREIQNEHFRAASEPAGLERGVIGSKAKHQAVSAFYAKLETEAEYVAAAAELTVNIEAVNARIDALNIRAAEISKAEKLIEKRESEVLRSVPLARVFSELGAQRVGYSDSAWLFDGRRYIIKDDEKSWNCDDETKGKAAIDLIMNVAKCKYKDAVLWLSSHFSKEFALSECLERTSDNIKEIQKSAVAAEVIQVQQLKVLHSRVIRGTSDDLIFRR